MATFGDSARTRVGEFAIAVGAPYSLDYTVTFGHVSAKGRSHVLDGLEGAMMDQDFIQTDALINPGNSGGPLVNIDGEVIGINTLIRGLHTGIGFAIPSNLAKEISDHLVADGKFTRAWLGISIGSLRENEDFRDMIPGVKDGVVVSGVLQDGPAAKSDLKAGDVITAVDGRAVATAQELRTEIRDKKVGQPVVLDVVRKGASTQVKVSPGEWVQEPAVVVDAKSESIQGGPPPTLGVKVQALTPELAARLGLTNGEGVLVASVERNSLAARKGLKAGDVITSIDEQPTNNPKQFNAALKKADLKRGVLMNYISGSTPRFEVFKARP
jgi:serine protease Do